MRYVVSTPSQKLCIGVPHLCILQIKSFVLRWKICLNPFIALHLRFAGSLCLTMLKYLPGCYWRSCLWCVVLNFQARANYPQEWINYFILCNLWWCTLFPHSGNGPASSQNETAGYTKSFDCRTTMIAPQGVALITVPVTIKIVDGLIDQEELFAVLFCSRLIETRLVRLLRFKHGEVSPPLVFTIIVCIMALHLTSAPVTRLLDSGSVSAYYVFNHKPQLAYLQKPPGIWPKSSWWNSTILQWHVCILIPIFSLWKENSGFVCLWCRFGYNSKEHVLLCPWSIRSSWCKADRAWQASL